MTAVNEGVTLEIIGTHQGRIVALVGGQPFAATTRDLLSALSTLIEYDRETVTVHGYGARSCPRPMPAISPPGPYGCASMGAIRRRASRSTRWPLTTTTYPLPGRGKRPVPARPSHASPYGRSAPRRGRVSHHKSRTHGPTPNCLTCHTSTATTLTERTRQYE